MGEELIETGSAVVQELLSELTLSYVLDSSLKAKKLELKLDNLLAKVTVEGTVLLLILGFLEDSLDNNLKVLNGFSIMLKDISLRIVARLIRCLNVAEHVPTELLEFLIEVVRCDDVDDQTNLLAKVLLTLCLIDHSLTLCNQLISHFVSFLAREHLLFSLRLSHVVMMSWLVSVELEVTLFTAFTLGALVVGSVLVVAALFVLIIRSISTLSSTLVVLLGVLSALVEVALLSLGRDLLDLSFGLV